MRFVRWAGLLGLVLAGPSCLGDHPDAGPRSFAGPWAGYVDGVPAWAFLEQRLGGEVAGNLTYPDAALVGTAEGETLTFTLSAANVGCAGLWQGSAIVEALPDRERLHLDASGATSCGGAARLSGWLDRLTCPSDRAVCGPDESGRAPRCTDLLADASSCGDCGHACGEGQVCTRGTCLVPACTGPVPLEAPASVAVGGTYVTLALADADGDGALDAIVANRAGVAVLPGDGAGGFGAPVASTLDGAVAADAGDLDGDGRADLVVYATRQDPAGVSAWQGSVHVLLGRGDGTFAAGQVVDAGEDRGWDLTGRRPLALADLDGDGVLDLAARAGQAPLLHLRRGLGDGTFGPAREHTLSGAVRALAAADLDGDGDVDLAVVTLDEGWRSEVEVLLGHGDGTFAAPAAAGAVSVGQDLAAGDLDGDGVPDLAVARTLAGVFCADLLLGHGDGTFTHATSLTCPSALGVAVADLDADGAADVITSGSRLALHLGRGDGTFAAAFEVPFADGGAAYGVAVADLDGRGGLDLVVPATLTPAVSAVRTYLACRPR